MSRPGWRFLPVPALAACLGLGLSAGAGLPLAGFRASTPGLPVLLADARAADRFLSVADDIPLMPGLTENVDAATVFDKPSGRIVNAEARGSLAAVAVRAFYAATLPQLGWQPAGTNVWQRETEQLRLGFEGTDLALTVRFEILPKQ